MRLLGRCLRMTNFVELRKGEVSRMHHAPTSGSVKLHSCVTTLGQQGTEVQGGRSSTLGCMSPCALLTLRFSETEASPGKYPATPARARGSACGRGVAALSADLAAQIRREVSGEVWRRTPQLVYGLVYKGLGALAGASPVLQLSCKWWKNKTADERTRTAYPCSSYEFACVHSSPYWCVRFSRLFMRFSMIWRYHFVQRVPVCVSPVAVRLQYMHGRQFVL